MMESWVLRKKNVLVLDGLSGVVGLIDAASNVGGVPTGDCAARAATRASSSTTTHDAARSENCTISGPIVLRALRRGGDQEGRERVRHLGLGVVPRGQLVIRPSLVASTLRKRV